MTNNNGSQFCSTGCKNGHRITVAIREAHAPSWPGPRHPSSRHTDRPTDVRSIQSLLSYFWGESSK